MLERLSFDITFPSGKRIKQAIDFQRGTTAITGPNGTGKSLILEMVSYALFGIEAVRGSADDYKSSWVELWLSIRGASYRIERKNGSSAFILDASAQPVASGTKAVNAKIAELLGYGYNVYAVSNLIGQGQIEALGAMKPAERKRLVDNVIGLDSLDTVAEWCSSTASIKRAEATGMEAALVPPEEPVKPEGYEPSDEIKIKIETLSGLKSERDQIIGWLAHPVPKPVEPTCSVTEPVDHLQARVDEFRAAEADMRSLRYQIDAIPEAKHKLAELDALQAELDASVAWTAYRKALPTVPRPTVSIEAAQADLEAWEAFNRWVWAKDAYDKHKVQCPNCDHEFSASAEDPGPQPRCPDLSVQDLKTQMALHAAWAVVPPEPEMPCPLLRTINFTQADLNQWRLAAEKAKERKALEKKLKDFILPVDRSSDLSARQRYDAEKVAYDQLKSRYDAWAAEHATKQARLAVLGDVDDLLAQAQEAYNTATIYERLARRYDALLLAFYEAQEKVEECRRLEAEYKKSAQAMKALKVRVKSFLVPSLNKVASHLIRQMTAGQHQELLEVQVSEDFDIRVDGQPLETLNGSGKTVANLAVRIGLGQILTNKVFSVLMCDEVDAACDEVRAAAIADCLRALTPNIAQVVMVSHKDIDADNYITA